MRYTAPPAQQLRVGFHPTNLGTVTTTRDFTPHGDMDGHEVVAPGTQPESKGYIGERFDPETGLQYLNARYYDPKLGLFTQGDWWDPTLPGVGTNRYAYSHGDPVNFSDPNGHAAHWRAALGATIGGVLDVVSQVVFDDRELSDIDWGQAGSTAAVTGLSSALGPPAAQATAKAFGVKAVSSSIASRAVNRKANVLDSIMGSATAGAIASAEKIRQNLNDPDAGWSDGVVQTALITSAATMVGDFGGKSLFPSRYNMFGGSKPEVITPSSQRVVSAAGATSIGVIGARLVEENAPNENPSSNISYGSEPDHPDMAGADEGDW